MPIRTFELSTSGEAKTSAEKTGKQVNESASSVVCERIHYYRERQKMEKKTLGKLVGVTGNAVSNWESGRTQPDISLLPKICTALHITLYDLFDIDGPAAQHTYREWHLIECYRRLSEAHQSVVKTLINALLAAEKPVKPRVIRKCIYCSRSLAAGVGDPTEFEENGEPIYLYASDEVDKADYVFTVNGDSMEPEYHSGDMVLVQSKEKNPNLSYGSVGAFISGNETYIKVYERDGLHSLNPEYATMRFGEDDRVYLIGRVVGILDPSEIATWEDVEKYTSLYCDESGAQDD